MLKYHIYLVCMYVCMFVDGWGDFQVPSRLSMLTTGGWDFLY